MMYYAGIDVSLESASVCVIDAAGRIIREGKVASEPEALTGWLKESGMSLEGVGLEAGPLSQWLHSGLRQAGIAAELLETRHVRRAFEIMPVKTDRKDARGIADLMRLGWVRPGACKASAGQETPAVVTARQLVPKEGQEGGAGPRGHVRDSAGIWTEGRQDDAGEVRGAGEGARRRQSEPGEDCPVTAGGARRATPRVQRLRAAAARHGAQRHACTAFDVDPRRRHDRG